jgi:maltose/moltooligosaccharide transporter
MKLDYKKTLLIGFGFLATSIAWAVYNTYVPLILDNYIPNSFTLWIIPGIFCLQKTAAIGAIMAIDNVFGAIFQPIFGNLSDKTVTRFGRRMPYMLVGIPVCAVLFFLVPFTTTVYSLMAVVIIFNFVMSTWRSPVIALMPDLTPSKFRSQANGIINFMGGIGTLIAFFAGGLLFKAGGMPLPFLVSSVVMIGAVVILKIFIKEPMRPVEDEPEETVRQEKMELSIEEKRLKKRSLIAILLAIFFWFMAYNAVETFFSTYITKTNASMDAGDASLLMSVFSLSFLIFAIPAGFIGKRFGRKKTILTGLTGITVLFAIMYFVNAQNILLILLILGGICWALINVNSLPMVVDMTGYASLGKYTGYYYLFSFSAAIASPILFGAFRDLIGSYHILFIYSAIAFLAAWVCMLFIAPGHGESKKVKTDFLQDDIG